MSELIIANGSPYTLENVLPFKHSGRFLNFQKPLFIQVNNVEAFSLYNSKYKSQALIIEHEQLNEIIRMIRHETGLLNDENEEESQFVKVNEKSIISGVHSFLQDRVRYRCDIILSVHVLDTPKIRLFAERINISELIKNVRTIPDFQDAI